MKKQIVFFFCFLLLAGVCYAQPKTKPVAKPASSELKKLLLDIDLPYKVVNDSLVVIPYEGENIKSYQVVVQKIGDLYIIFTDLKEALPGKIDSTKYKYLLEQNDHFDIIKIGLSAEDGSVYVRADLYKAGVGSAMLKRVISQVANVTNIIGGDLK